VTTNLPTTGLTGRLILHAHTLDEVAVYDADGTELASRPLPPDAPGPDAWTRALANLGYARTTRGSPVRVGSSVASSRSDRTTLRPARH
jgi:hypothetical protein